MERANSVTDCCYVAAEGVTDIYQHRRLKNLISIYKAVNVMLGKDDLYKVYLETLHFLIHECIVRPLTCNKFNIVTCISIARQLVAKHILAATNGQATIEELQFLCNSNINTPLLQ
jgi:hypothetical protein